MASCGHETRDDSEVELAAFIGTFGTFTNHGHGEKPSRASSIEGYALQLREERSLHVNEISRRCETDPESRVACFESINNASKQGKQETSILRLAPDSAYVSQRHPIIYVQFLFISFQVLHARSISITRRRELNTNPASSILNQVANTNFLRRALIVRKKS